MPLSEAIEIVAEPVGSIPVTLIGKTYTLKPPKTAVAMSLAVNAQTLQDHPERIREVVQTWVTQAFGKKDGEAVMKRLDDPDDDLDLPHIMQLIEKVVERQTGNPTS